MIEAVHIAPPNQLQVDQWPCERALCFLPRWRQLQPTYCGGGLAEIRAALDDLAEDE